MTTELKQILRVIGGTKGDHCAYPVQIDAAGRGCTGCCSYCYSRSLLEFRHMWDTRGTAKVDMSKVHLLFEKAFDDKAETNDAKALRECGALRIGGMTDPLLHNREHTHALIELCNAYKLPYLLFTKGLLQPSLAVLNKDLATVQMSLGTLNENWLSRCEPGAPSAYDRLASLEESVDAGIRTILRLAPIIPMHELYHRGMLEDMLESSPDGVIGEFIRYSGVIGKQMSEIGFDYKTCKPEHQVNYHGQVVYSQEYRDSVYCEMRKICEDDFDVPFSVCENEGFDFFKKYWVGKHKNCCMGVR